MNRASQKLTAFALVTSMLVVAGALWFFLGDHGWWHDHGESFGELLHERGHWYLELFVGGLQIVVLDVFFGLVVWRLVLKPYIANRQARVVAEEHKIHGIPDHDHELHEQNRALQEARLLEDVKEAVGMLDRGESAAARRALDSAIARWRRR